MRDGEIAVILYSNQNRGDFNCDFVFFQVQYQSWPAGGTVAPGSPP